MNLFIGRLDEQQRRWYAAIESNRIGHGGDVLISKITGISKQAIRRGRKELADSLATRPADRVRSPGGGRLSTEKKWPSIKAALERILTNEIAGDPMSEQKWVRSSLGQLSKRLKEEGYQASTTTVSRLLKAMGISMKTNKRKEPRSDCSDRDEQFQYIASQRQAFGTAGLPIISVDTKKKELIGDFWRRGKSWCKDAEEVNAHDFPSMAKCRAVPYGVYDVTKNKGYVFVGTSADTPEFAVDAIVTWWKSEGCTAYPGANQLLILADGGGSNGCRSRAWKHHLQVNLSDALGLTVTVCHYPTGCSKWNPIEHRLFSYISINWAGKPLRTLEMMLGYIRDTTTQTGLSVKAFLVQESTYQQGQTVTNKDMERLSLQPHAACPDWNYTISPHESSV